MKRVVVITGGTKGLGLETALAFGRAGYFALSLYASDEHAAGKFMDRLSAEGVDGSACRHDVTSESPEVWDRREIRDAETITLIHNACAPFSPVPMHQLSWRDFEANLEVAIKGGWLCSQALIRLMLKTGRGTIVNILTSATEGAAPKGFGAYVTAKHALKGFTLALAAEYAHRGVRVFSASPGFMNTSLTARWDSRLRESIQAASKRITDPAAAAQRLLELVESADVAGCGEDYPL
jgi:NAD(P)-dependent dehydrogenase (short-subunit alcohol dehydrogenase family)